MQQVPFLAFYPHKVYTFLWREQFEHAAVKSHQS